VTSLGRIAAGFAGGTRARLLLTLQREAYEQALAPLPRINGPALIVGSAPGSSLPEGVGKDWFVITINASQTVAEEFGFPVPDLTVFRDGMMLPGAYQDMAWGFLRGRRTKHLVPVWGGPADDAGLARPMENFDFHADRLTSLNRHVRTAVIAEMSGAVLPRLGGHMSASNGLVAVALALKLGASPLVMAGFSFTRGGWKQVGSESTYRPHLQGDSRVLAGLRDRGRPVFAGNAEFAQETGLAVWSAH
jgi:hypothetical protein